jgi:hypothetical protein
MAQVMRVVSKGTLLGVVLSGLVFALFLVANTGYGVALRDVKYFNGWVLVACMVVMLFLISRKRVVILPFGRVRFWLVIHYYIGFLTIGVFVIHSRGRLPDSPLEWLLWCLFVLVAVSGIAGAVLSKIVPQRLAAQGERVIFERIPVFRAQLAADAEALALESIKGENRVSIAELYRKVLASYFARPRNILAHLRLSNRPLARLESELNSIERYLDDEGKERLARMHDLVRAKNNLDMQYANGGLLKLWLFLHIPPTFALLVAVVAHVVIAYAFSTGIP